MGRVKALNVGIVGGAAGCKAIMDMLFAEKLSQLRMKLIGVACINPNSAGYRYAREKGIYTTKDYRDLYKLKDLDMIVELTGCDEVANEIYQTKPGHVRLMDNVTVRLFWDIFQIEGERIAERKRTEEELRDTINRMEIAYEQSIIYAKQLSEEIGERKRAEEALLESERKYRLLFDNANDAIFIVQDDVIKFPNPKSQEIIGYHEDHLVPITFGELIIPEDRDMVLKRHKKRLKGEDLPSTYYFRIINGAGGQIWVEVNTALITWEASPAVLYFLRDITPQKKLETQLQQAQKMEAIGTLASGLAHDFNNLLMGMQGRTCLMLMNISSDHPHVKYLKGIEDLVQRGAGLTKQLLGFARGGKYEVRSTDLNEIIEKSLEMFGRTKKEIRIHRKYEKDIWTVKVDQGQIDQVFLNLYVNAWQAMAAGGDLYVETSNVVLDENYIKPFTVEPGNYVKVSVTDTGIGMDKETQQRIFEPFYTIKEMGRGTGLGLASAYGIIKNHGGIINVYSEKGQGTTFNIYLPAVEGVVSDQGLVVREKGILRGDGTILLVDDEDMIINIGQEILKEMGYKVLLARSGKEAIEVYDTNRDKIDMVIMDMIMPDMGGGEAYDKMKEINPNVKVLLSSGYGIEGQASDILNRGCGGFIQKPFNMKQLSQMMRKILDRL